MHFKQIIYNRVYKSQHCKLNPNKQRLTIKLWGSLAMANESRWLYKKKPTIATFIRDYWDVTTLYTSDNKFNCVKCQIVLAESVKHQIYDSDPGSK